MSEYFCGLDLGQSQDYTALAIAERIMPADPKGKPSYHFRHLERLKLGTSYPAQVAYVKQVVEHLVKQPVGQLIKPRREVTLALDYTGVGRPVADMFQEAHLPCVLYAIGIHGGDVVTWDGHTVHVPKRDLVACVQVLLQSERLKVAEALPEANTLVKELLNFRVKIDPLTAHDSYSAWRENIHDDLVLAVALACWIAEHRRVFSMGGR